MMGRDMGTPTRRLLAADGRPEGGADLTISQSKLTFTSLHRPCVRPLQRLFIDIHRRTIDVNGHVDLRL